MTMIPSSGAESYQLIVQSLEHLGVYVGGLCTSYCVSYVSRLRSVSENEIGRMNKSRPYLRRRRQRHRMTSADDSIVAAFSGRGPDSDRLSSANAEMRGAGSGTPMLHVPRERHRAELLLPV